MSNERMNRLRAKQKSRRVSFAVFVVVLVAASAAAGAYRLGVFDGDDGAPVAETEPSNGGKGRGGKPEPEPTSTIGTAEPLGIEGLTTFRGNATRTYYGEGPVPEDPQVQWRYPSSGGMCSESTDQEGTRTWCGTGWTGQPNVVEVEGQTQVRFGAYDRAIHIVDGDTGRDVYQPFTTGDLIKGTVSSDPDGFPLLYSGSRDNYLRIFALDRGDRPVELWKLSSESAPDPVWNNDWDGSPLIIDDYLLEGGENSWFYVVELNRDYDNRGQVTVDPHVRLTVPGFDQQLFSDLGDQEVSIENSVAYADGIVYFANSGGLVQGWDISAVLDGRKSAHRVFRFWTGEDTDASVVIDEEGYLYVASELERHNARSSEVGQLMKLDPSERKDPIVWDIPIPGVGGGDGGIWATPGLYGDVVFAATNTGRILAVDRASGRIRWELELPPPTWTSPVIVDGVLILGDCAGVLHAYDLAEDPLSHRPRERWSVELGGCIESTPAVWHGMVYVGTRAGAVYGIGDRG
jgi:outer membrane protein assembly factor BamB